MLKLVHATKEDINLILGYMESFYAIDDYPFDKELATANLYEFMANDALGVLFLVDLEGKSVGYLALTYGFSFEYGGRDAFIDEFFLVEEARGKGYGSEVLNLLESEAIRREVKAMHLEVEPHNVRGNRIYKNAGFESNDRRLMTRRLR